MPATYRAVFDLALRYPGVTESFCHGTPALFVGKKLLARLREDGRTLMLKVAMETREAYFEQAPDTFFITDHYRTYPAVLIDLPTVRWAWLPPMVETAWRLVAPPRQVAAWDAAQLGAARG